MIKKTFIIFFKLVVGFFACSILLVCIYKFVSPPVTPLMVMRLAQGKATGIDYKWRSFDNISPNLFRAVIGSEDAKFFHHDGVDWKAIRNAQHYNEVKDGKKVRGGSTISQQTAKNVFLTPHRSYIRKGLELYFTYLIEYIWGKKRILEVYANVVEWAPGVYGAEAAAEHHFQRHASELTARQAAQMAVVLPNPIRWSASNPTPYIVSRANWAQGRMGSISLNSIK
jgi:monofunctional biosynthetic peptidoglycan transglycosylase